MSDKLQLFSFKPEPQKLKNGETVYIRRMSAGDQLAWFDGLPENAETDNTKNPLSVSASLLVRTLCQQDGKRHFEDGDESLVLDIDADDFAALANTALLLNGIGKEANEAIKKK